MGAGIAANKVSDLHYLKIYFKFNIQDRTKTGSYVKASAAKKRQAVKTSDLEGASDESK